MKRIDKNYTKLIGQGENSDLLVSVINFDKKFDEYFEINYLETEKSLLEELTDEQTYPGLEDTALSTSYLDYFQIYDLMPSGETLIDLGAGYCRGTLLFNALGEKSCLSIELVGKRAQVALSKYPDEVIIGDIINKKFKLPSEKYYFIYLPVGPVLFEIINKVIEQRIEATFIVIESHGDLINYLSFLPEVFELQRNDLKTSLPRHNKNIHIYKSKLLNKDLGEYRIDESLPLWHLDNYDKNIVLNIESTVPGSSNKIWSAPIGGSIPVLYNNLMALWVEKPARILQLNTQDKILGFDTVSY